MTQQPQKLLKSAALFNRSRSGAFSALVLPLIAQKKGICDVALDDLFHFEMVGLTDFR